MTRVINTPEGTKDRLFSECRERRQVQDALTKLFLRRGCAEVSTPEVEYYDLFLQSGNPLPQEAMLKIIDRSGKIMVMRPDCTTPIARVAATKLGTLPLPQRLYYNQTVFRSGDAHKATSSEIAQCGVELIGAGGQRADLEMLALAVDSLKATGLERFHIEIGHVGFFRALAEKIDLPQEEIEAMRLLIEGKNFAALVDLLEPYKNQAAGRTLQRLSHLFGGAEMLDEAEALSGGSQVLDYLRGLYGELEAAGYGQYIRFDLGLVHQIDYYTGLVFRGYGEGAGDAILSGGRYDKLLAAFGRPAQAIGFAVDVDAVAACLPPRNSAEIGLLIHVQAGELAHALNYLDNQPVGSCELSPCETLEASLTLAKGKGIGRIVVLEQGRERLVEV